MALATPKELDRAYDDERLRWLRKRFFVYAGLSVGLSFLGLLVSFLMIYIGPSETAGEIIDTALADSRVYWLSESMVTLAVVLAFIAAVRWVSLEARSRAQTLRLIYGLFVAAHLLEVGHLLLVGLWIDPSAAMGPIHDQALVVLFLTHFIAAIIIPWTVRESAQPLIPILIVYAFLIALITVEPIGHRVADLIALSLVGAPGMAVCWLKQRWFQRRFHFRTYRDVYYYVSREVEQARALHESFFPSPIDEGPLLLDYHYQPMSQLGGDYLHAHIYRDDDGQPESLLCAVIDVTGHGLPATLTANHLHALLKRQTQQARRPNSGELLADLNRYMHESFSGLSVFATAIVMRLDLAEERVVWASAGHPPAFLVSEGRCEPALESTACLLGVLEPELFQAEQREIALSENVSIVAYTDGASELPLPDGEMLGINGFAQRIAALSAKGPFDCQQVMKDLAATTVGERQDDILLAQLALGSMTKVTEAEEQDPVAACGLA